MSTTTTTTTTTLPDEGVPRLIYARASEDVRYIFDLARAVCGFARPSSERLANDARLASDARYFFHIAASSTGFAIPENRAAPLTSVDTALLQYLERWTSEPVSPDVTVCECVYCAAAGDAGYDAIHNHADDAGVDGVDGASPLREAFGGKLSAGKSTAVKRLIATRGGVEVSFAAPLYFLLHAAQRRLGRHVTKDRAFLQYVGTEWGRVVEDGVWIRLARQRIERHAKCNVYISDARFANEVEATRAWGFRIYRIVRPETSADGTTLIDRLGSGSTAHASEHGLDGVEMMTFHNDGTLAQFYAKIDALADA